jgi:hypothetical protein
VTEFFKVPISVKKIAVRGCVTEFFKVHISINFALFKHSMTLQHVNSVHPQASRRLELCQEVQLEVEAIARLELDD